MGKCGKTKDSNKQTIHRKGWAVLEKTSFQWTNVQRAVDIGAKADEIVWEF